MSDTRSVDILIVALLAFVLSKLSASDTEAGGWLLVVIVAVGAQIFVSLRRWWRS